MITFVGSQFIEACVAAITTGILAFTSGHTAWCAPGDLHDEEIIAIYYEPNAEPRTEAIGNIPLEHNAFLVSHEKGLLYTVGWETALGDEWSKDRVMTCRVVGGQEFLLFRGAFQDGFVTGQQFLDLRGAIGEGLVCVDQTLP